MRAGLLGAGVRALRDAGADQRPGLHGRAVGPVEDHLEVVVGPADRAARDRVGPRRGGVAGRSAGDQEGQGEEQQQAHAGLTHRAVDRLHRARPRECDARAVTRTVGLEDVRAARVLLEGVARTTPLEGLRGLSEQVGGPVLLKCENLQRTGSFKIRGAYVRIARLSDEQRAVGVVAASAGNHAQGVALAASLLGCRVDGLHAGRRAAAQGRGDPGVRRGRAPRRPHRRRGAAWPRGRSPPRPVAVLIHPFDHADVIAGQGTVGLEMLEQCPDVRTVVVCTGGGGLVAGIAAAVKGLRARRAGGRRAGERGGVLPRVARGRPAGAAGRP